LVRSAGSGQVTLGGVVRCGGGRNCETRRREGWRAEGHAEGESLV